MAGPKFDVATEKGIGAFNGFMGSKSYVQGWEYSEADSEYFAKFESWPESVKYPHASRWYYHIAAIKGVRGPVSAPVAASATVVPEKKEEEDDFDVFGEDDDEEEEPKESRKDMMARLKKEAEERTAKKEAKQRTLCAIEVKPFGTEQDLMALFKKFSSEIKQDGLKWAENCSLVDVAFGIKKIVTTFTMGAANSSDDVIEAIEAYEDDVQSVELLSMNVL